MRWIPATAMLTLIVALSTPAAAGAFTLEPLGSAAAPIFLTSEPADPNRLYVVERAGTIRRLGAPGIFLDITPQVSGGGERGLLSMAFAPDYASSGRFYVFHTDPGGDLTVAEYHRASAESADPASRRVVLVIEHSAQANHNGGQLAFGPDGYLYVSTGDGGGSSDPMANGQNLGVLLGKVLRIDPRPAGGAAYAVPPGNPFAGTPGAAPEIWAYGFRNPWRFSFDRATGDLIVADVGESTWEEIDFAPLAAGGGRGANYGWSCFEGREVFNPACATVAQAPPVLQQPHTAGYCAITGGYVVRDPGIPELAGRYVYSDYCVPALRSVALAAPDASGDRAEAASVAQLASFGEDSCGRVYALSLTGPIYRLAGAAPTSCPSPASGTGAAGGRADTTGPRITFLNARTQRPLRGRRRLYARLRCDEPCRVRVRARVARRGARTRTLPAAGRRLAASAPVTIRWRLGRKRVRALRGMLAAKRPTRLRLVAVAVDAAGNSSRKGASIRLRR